MKYILMIIMFLCSLGISLLINKSKEERIVVLKEIKQSIKAFDIHNYFLHLKEGDNKHIAKVKGYVDDIANKKSKVKETKDAMIIEMNGIFSETSDGSMLTRWLSLVKKPNNAIKRDDVEKDCSVLIEKTKSEEKTNIYIAIALGVVLVIVLM